MVIRINRNDIQYRIKVLLILIPMMLIALLNYNNPDYISYITLYERYYPQNIFYGSQEIGFVYLNKLAISFGLPFHTFRNIVLIISYTLFVFALYKFAKRENVSCAIVLLAYLFMSYISDVIQIRQFLANSICFVALTFLYEKSRKHTIFFIGLVVASSFIHISTIVYLIFVLVAINKDRKFLRNTSLILSITTIVFGGILYRYSDFIFGFLMRSGIRAKIDEADALVRTFNIRTVLVFVIAMYISILCEKDNFIGEKADDYISRINIFFPFFVALTTLHNSGGRFLHVLCLIWVIDLIRRIKSPELKYKNLYLFSVLLVIFFLGVSFWIPGTGNFTHSTITIFKYNYLF